MSIKVNCKNLVLFGVSHQFTQIGDAQFQCANLHVSPLPFSAHNIKRIKSNCYTTQLSYYCHHCRFSWSSASLSSNDVSLHLLLEMLPKVFYVLSKMGSSHDSFIFSGCLWCCLSLQSQVGVRLYHKRLRCY